MAGFEVLSITKEIDDNIPPKFGLLSRNHCAVGTPGIIPDMFGKATVYGIPMDVVYGFSKVFFGVNELALKIFLE